MGPVRYWQAWDKPLPASWEPAGPTGETSAPALAEKAHEAFSLGGFGAPACVLPKAAAGMGQGRALGRCATFDKIFNKIV